MDTMHRLMRTGRLSLAAVWLLTAAVSLWELQGQSRGLLRDAGLGADDMAHALVFTASAVDLAIGLALCCWPRRITFSVALVNTLAFTLLASVLTPAQWLHPFGPLLKNLPILAWLIVLREHSAS